MFLYHFTVQPPSGIIQAVYGNFSGPKEQEIISAKGRVLELLRLDAEGKLQSILSTEVFGVIRSIVPFRLTGGNKDYLIVGSDSGRIVILEYNPTKNKFDKVHQETYGKSGCRRIVPGQHLATDPKGRAVMIASLEKQKLVYILNRDSAARLTISSPLEAHKAHTIIYSICGVDVGFENPIFACLELDYQDEEGPQKNLVYYELDLGLNHVVRKWSDPVDNGSNMLLTVPGGTDGPGGVLVCSENFITYKNQGHNDVRVFLPRRTGVPETEKILIVSAGSLKQKGFFFFLLQSDYGDLYKVSLDFSEDQVNNIKISYFDTIPVSNSLVVMKTGFLFVASEFGNHHLYQFQGLGENQNENEIGQVGSEPVRFVPQPLKNLLMLDEINSLAPILDFQVANITKEETQQIYTLCGRGTSATLKTLKHGLAVSEMAVSPLPGNPSAVWTVRMQAKDDFDKYIVVSFVNATLVLSIGETVEEATDSGLLTNRPTIHVANIGEDGIIQVHPNGIRHIRGDKPLREWKTPGKKTIVHASSNERQVAIALSGGDIIYFELDPMGQLMEVDKKFMGREVACLNIAPVPEGLARARFLAVGDWDNTVRIFSLNPEDCLQQLHLQAVPTHPQSLCIAEIFGSEETSTLFLNIGLDNGVLLRSVIDHVTGELTDQRTRFLGSRPVKLFRTVIRSSPAVLALSSRSWLGYNYQSRYQMTPLSYSTLEYASSFSSEQCPEGIVAIAGDTLRIITIDRLGETFNQQEIPLVHTPRRFIIHPQSENLIIIETDHNSYSTQEREKFKWVEERKPRPSDDDMEVDMQDYENELMEQKLIGEPRPGPGKWASCIRVLDAVENKTVDLIELGNNEAAISLCTCVFHDKGGEVFLVVGTVKDWVLQPRSFTSGFIHVYRMIEGKQLQFLHKTPVDGIPQALCPFQGRLLVGVGKALRIYDLGKKKLLRKCENKNFPNFITSIYTQGDRIYLSDVSQAVFFCKYRKMDNQLYVFADETTPRWITCINVLDYDTIAGTDKFGNVFVSRLPHQVSDEIEEDPTGSKFRTDQGYLNGAPHKLNEIMMFHVGETATKIAKTSFYPGGAEALIYSTMIGSIGAFAPFVSREDVDFFTHLEMHMRQENPPLCGRDHLSYRSYYSPVKVCA